MPTTRIADGAYVFDNDNANSYEQHRCLAAAYDPLTTARLAETGVTDGWNCLEVGAGGGSVAHWLADRVAPSGSVLATDVKPQHITERAGLTTVRHDVVTDPLREGAFDLVHARLLLMHLPERLAVLDKLVRSLKPGGWLQLDECDVSYGPSLLAADEHAREIYETFLAARAAVMDAARADGGWGQRVASAMRNAGLVGIDPRPQVELWWASSPGLRLLVHDTFHLRNQLVAVGLTDHHLEAVRAVMSDPSFLATSCPMYSVRGRRPIVAERRKGLTRR